MYDASVKVPTGIELGAVYQFGNFDQCMRINSDDHKRPITTNDEDDDRKGGGGSGRNDVKPKYCLADVTMRGYSVRSEAARNFEVGHGVLDKKFYIRVLGATLFIPYVHKFANIHNTYIYDMI